ncbi:hypothetical protein, partial [Algoriphagus sp.]|uniref:hypothetical protein n=1 Tax=Algoriphagus sp. TaxID=1872435 RepID=UPI003F72AD28
QNIQCKPSVRTRASPRRDSIVRAYGTSPNQLVITILAVETDGNIMDRPDGTQNCTAHCD